MRGPLVSVLWSSYSPAYIYLKSDTERDLVHIQSLLDSKIASKLSDKTIGYEIPKISYPGSQEIKTLARIKNRRAKIPLGEVKKFGKLHLWK